MLKNLFKATIFYYDTHECRYNFKFILNKGWLASLKDNKVLLEKLLSAHLPFKERKCFALVGLDTEFHFFEKIKEDDIAMPFGLAMTV